MFLAGEFLMLCLLFVVVLCPANFVLQWHSKKQPVWNRFNRLAPQLQVGLVLSMWHGQAPLILGHFGTPEQLDSICSSDLVVVAGASIFSTWRVCYRPWDKSAFATGVKMDAVVQDELKKMQGDVNWGTSSHSWVSLANHPSKTMRRFLLKNWT